MKELSVEEKAKRYDEALTKARNIVNSINVGLIGKDSFEAVFTELRESEDERIRKALRERIIRYDPNNEILIKEEGISQKQFIAWLEKQGKHTEFTGKQDDTKLRKYIEVASNVLMKLLESDKFQKDAREHLFDKGDNDLSSIYDIYAEEAVKYAKALYKHLNKS